MTEMKLTLMAAALLLAGCVSVPAIDPASLPASAPAFKEAPAASTATNAQEQGAWWRVFQDPILDALVDRAERNNNSIHVAAARLAQARALVRTADAQRMPQVGVGGGVSRSADLITGGRPLTVGAAGANLAYEIDLFGRLAEATRAANLDAK